MAGNGGRRRRSHPVRTRRPGGAIAQSSQKALPTPPAANARAGSAGRGARPRGFVAAGRAELAASRRAGSAVRGAGARSPRRQRSGAPGRYFFFLAAFDAAAARTSACSAVPSIAAPSWRSIARRVLPSRLELNKPLGSGNDAPWAKVSLTALL